MRPLDFTPLWLVLPLLALEPATASAQQVDHYRLVMPPARYASGPYLYPVKLHRMPNDQRLGVCVNVVATRGGLASPDLGCTKVGPVSCDVYLPKKRTIPKLLADHIVLHELAHCRGWPGNHPD
jgi:hypothetical protein